MDAHRCPLHWSVEFMLINVSVLCGISTGLSFFFRKNSSRTGIGYAPGSVLPQVIMYVSIIYLSYIYHLSNIFTKKNGEKERSDKNGMAIADMK